MLKSNTWNAHTVLVRFKVCAILRSSREAGSSEWHPEIINSFFVFQCIPVSVKSCMNSMFPARFPGVFVAFGLPWLNFRSCIQKYTPKKKWNHVGVCLVFVNRLTFCLLLYKHSKPEHLEL